MNSPRPSGVRLTAGLVALAWAATLAGTAVALAGGVSWRIGPLSIRAHNALIPFVIAAIGLAVAWRGRGAQLRDTLEWCWSAIERCAAVAALMAAIATVVIGLTWGTYVAGGPDSYCYLNQAEMLARGELRQPQPLAAQAPWPNAGATFAPTGHLPAARDAGAIVPACPAGYPLMMAAAKRLAGRPAMFWVVPMMGGLAIWLTFLLGRRLAGDLTGGAAAILLAGSPAFLYQVVQPMSDVPAVACWSAALLAALAERRTIRGDVIAGLATGAALLVRPNLVPVAAVVVAVRYGTGGFKSLFGFAAGSVPFVISILVLNRAMHGGALESGYGKLGDLFTLAHVAGNLRRYPMWLIETQTPSVLLALIAPLVLRQQGRERLAWWLIAFALVTFACYLPYTVWDAWWFLRFVLPAFPPLLVLSSVVAIAALVRLRPAWRTVAFISLGSFLMVFQLNTAARRAVFELRDLEARFRVAGEYVARRLPSNAIVLADTESGSVRFYSGRQTVVWSALDPAWLDRALDYLRAQGYRPYVLLESDEEPLFRAQFGSAGGLGQLSWPPLAEIIHRVRIYDPDDLARYRRGERIQTDYFWARN